jgi:hypothetical protein
MFFSTYILHQRPEKIKSFSLFGAFAAVFGLLQRAFAFLILLF